MLSSQDWLKAGEILLLKNGAKGLSIASLCKSLSVTKGSFYHHFKNMDEYRSALEAFMKKNGNNVSTQKETVEEKKLAWFNTALHILRSKGYQCVTLDELYSDMGVSKGAFYYLFENRDVFIKELLKFWEKETLGDILKLAKQEQADLKTVDDILELSQKLSSRRKIDVQIRAWALVDKNVMRFQKKLDKHQLEACKIIISQLFDVDETKADALSKTAYLSYIGSQQIVPQISEEQWADSLKIFIPLISAL